MRRLTRLVAVVAALALLPAGASAQDDLRDQLEDTRGERERVEADLEEIQRQEGDARARLSTIESALAEAEAQLEALAGQLEEAEAEFEQADRRSREGRTRLLEVEAELAEAEDELAAKRDRLETRVRSAYKYGGVSFAEAFLVLTEADDVGDLMSSSTYLAHVMNDDRVLLDDVAVMLTQIEEQRLEAAALRRDAEREAAIAAAAAAEMERAAAEQERLTELVREQQEEREAALEALREDRAAMEGHLAGLDAESQRIEDQLASIAHQQAEEARRAEEAAHRHAQEEARRVEEAARQYQAACEDEANAEETGADEAADGADEAADGADKAADGSDGGEGSEDAEGADTAVDCEQPPPTAAPPSVSGNNGTWTRPVGGPVTSPFGPRWGRNHNGVDLGGAVGTGVVAAQDGVVVHVTNSCGPISSWGCGGGFGNYVTVSHAGGMATIYAHLSSVSVGVGQQVGGGQAIGAIGNSGNSYGPHLHFEVRDAGAPRNPCSYIGC